MRQATARRWQFDAVSNAFKAWENCSEQRNRGNPSSSAGGTFGVGLIPAFGPRTHLTFSLFGGWCCLFEARAGLCRPRMFSESLMFLGHAAFSYFCAALWILCFDVLEKHLLGLPHTQL